MFKNVNLQTLLSGSFLFMGLLVLIVALVGWSGNFRLTNHISTLGDNAFPSVVNLWKISEGQTRIESADQVILNPRATKELTQKKLLTIEKAWQQISEGFKGYEKLTHTPEEDRLYKKFIQDWEKWKEAHKRFLELHQEFQKIGIFNPRKVQIDLLIQGKGNSPEMAATKAADILLDKMNMESFIKKGAEFETAKESLQELLAYNDELAAAANQSAAQDVVQTRFWVVLGMVLGPLTAVIFGIYFITKIVRPLATQVQQSGIQVTTSATQISASGKQLEATIAEQVASTNEVVATAKEIAATSFELVKTMEEVAGMAIATTTAAGGGQKQLMLLETTMSQLAFATNSIFDKLGVISEKANNINSIVTIISKVADQTNLLSLNAAIEAEKAGEYGLGFGVVAREIRRLADQSAIASLDIEQMVKQMQSAVASGVMEMDKFTKEVSRGVEDIRNISVQIAQIIEQVQALTPRFEVVNQGMEAQSEGAGQISEAMVQLSEASHQTAIALREINKAIEQLNLAAHGLQQATRTLK